MSVASRLAEVRARIGRAAAQAGRSPDAVTLIAVSKKQPVARLVEAFDAGQRDFGENLAQELRTHADALRETGRQARWHFVGTLQRNKINLVLAHAFMVQSVDRGELAVALSKRAPATGIDVLVQVNVGGEAQKGGVAPDEALPFADEVVALPGLRLRGLMAIPPADADPRPFFVMLHQLFAALRARPAGVRADVLSMGMSDDFEIAIACGATCVRVGTAIFGERHAETQP